jgi:hypothetical protein
MLKGKAKLAVLDNQIKMNKDQLAVSSKNSMT